MSGGVRTSEGIEPKPSLRRIILPITLVLGTFFCGYAGLFWGVKEDLPAPQSAVRYPLSPTNQNIIREQFAEDTKNYRTIDASVFVLRGDTPQEAQSYWRDAFVTKRNWTQLDAPAQPRDRGKANFTMLGFNRSGSKVIIAIAQADQLLAQETELSRLIKTANYRPGDTVAIMIAGDLK